MLLRIALSLPVLAGLSWGAERWVATWAPSPSPQLADVGQIRAAKLAFENQTLRQIVHVSLGGESLRVRLSNVFGKDKVEIGANSTVDRGAIGDTVIGEGTKIDNLVQIAHNARIGRHCLIVSQAGVAGSAELGDFVVIAGQVGVADHVRIGSGARIAGQSGLLPHTSYEAGQDYGGMPARPLKEWVRELAAVKALVRQKKKDSP